MSGATFRKSATERTMFSAGRFSPVGLVIAILIDFRCGSADKDAVAKDRIAQSHSASFLVIVPYWKDKISKVKQLLSSRAPPQGEECSVMSDAFSANLTEQPLKCIQVRRIPGDPSPTEGLRMRSEERRVGKEGRCGGGR